MEQNERSVWATLFAPPSPGHVLIPLETILYYERRHWAILIQPFLETLGALIFITALAGGDSEDGIGLFGGFVLLFAIGMFFYQSQKKEWSNAVAYGSAAGLLIAFILLGRVWLAVAAVIFIVGRFAFRFMIWAFYEHLYITNRRIIMATGFLGSEINTMPLTRVTDISYRTTVWADLFRYGILRVESAGQDQALSLIPYLDDPSRFYNILINRTTAAVGSVTDVEVEPPAREPLDEDDGSGTLAP